MPGDYDELRVLVVAENASARFGGEAILPLHYFSRLRARGVEAWLVVHARSRENLQERLPDEQSRIHYIEDNWAHRALWRLGKLLPSRVATNSTGLLLHAVTQILQRRVVRRLIAEQHVTVVHEPTPVSPRAPSMLWNVAAPVVIGPLNGGMTFPPGFTVYQSRFERVFMRLGRAAAHVVNWLVPGKREAAVVLVANPRTRAALPRGCDRNVIELVENGVDLGLFERSRDPNDLGPQVRPRPRFTFLGRLIDLKAVDLLLEAVRRASATVDLELAIIGDGPERQALGEQVKRLGLQDRVVFHGFVPQHECPGLLQSSDALVLPSLRECGGAVVLEAMAMGLPVLATRWGGPEDYLDDETGLLIDPITEAQFLDDLTKGLVRLAQSPELRDQLAAAGRKRVEEHYDWERKTDQIIAIYREAQG